MAIILELAANLATATLETTTRPLRVQYRPGVATSPAALRLADEIERAGGINELSALRGMADRLIALLLRMIVSWDMVETDGGPLVPLTDDGLAYIATEQLGMLFAALMGEARGGPPSASSAPTSRRSPGPGSKAPRSTSGRAASSRTRSRS